MVFGDMSVTVEFLYFHYILNPLLPRGDWRPSRALDGVYLLSFSFPPPSMNELQTENIPLFNFPIFDSLII